MTGDDVERWSTPEPDRYLIFTRRGIDISVYPDILAHLEKFRASLEPCPKDWQPTAEQEKWPGRKAGSYAWYEIQDNTAYWEKFLSKKIISTKISFRPTFCVDSSQSILANTAYLIDGGSCNEFLAIALNSSVAEYFFRSVFAGKQGGFYEVQPDGLGDFPVPTSGAGTILNSLDFSSAAPNPALEQLLNGLIYELYFPDDLHERGLHLFDAAREAGLDRLSGLEGEKLATAAAEFTRQHLASGQPLRVMLSDLQTLDVVRIIEGKA